MAGPLGQRGGRGHVLRRRKGLVQFPDAPHRPRAGHETVPPGPAPAAQAEQRLRLRPDHVGGRHGGLEERVGRRGSLLVVPKGPSLLPQRRLQLREDRRGRRHLRGHRQRADVLGDRHRRGPHRPGIRHVHVHRRSGLRHPVRGTAEEGLQAFADVGHGPDDRAASCGR